MSTRPTEPGPATTLVQPVQPVVLLIANSYKQPACPTKPVRAEPASTMLRLPVQPIPTAEAMVLPAVRSVRTTEFIKTIKHLLVIMQELQILIVVMQPMLSYRLRVLMDRLAMAVLVQQSIPAYQTLINSA